MCAQKGSHTCDNVVATAACRALRSTGMTVPQGCPSSDVIEAICNFITFVVTTLNYFRASLVAILQQIQAVRRFIAAFHQLHLVTTSYSLPMEQ